MAKEVVFRDVTTAAHNSTVRKDDEFTMEEGQQLFSLENLDEDWVKVQVHTPFEALTDVEPAAGLVPSTSIEPAPPLNRAVAPYDYEPSYNEAVNAYLKEDEQIFGKIDREGNVSEPVTGYVSANYVKNAEDNKAIQFAPSFCGYERSQFIANLYEEESEDDSAAEAVAAAGPTRRAEGMVAVVLYDFEAYADDELTVKKGERLTVLDQENDDWWKCCSLDGNEGVVPAAFLDVRARVETLTACRLTWSFQIEPAD
ncbi:cytoskeletal protein binding protein [Tulasnella sp. 408]|nr:cytoskeletal protein binding protein [Tulasnella sp. 408]